MGRKNKHWYELRTRQRVGRKSWMKKSKFYFLQEPTRVVAKALKRHTDGTTVIGVEKVPKEKLMGEFPRATASDILQSQMLPHDDRHVVRSFLGLGDSLLKELKSDGRDSKEGDVFGVLEDLNIVSKRRRMIRRGFYDRERKKAAY